MNHPEDLQSAILDLEIDFEAKGGIQRFKTVGDFLTWLQEEEEFWAWINQPPARGHQGNIGDSLPRFQNFCRHCRTLIDQASNRWNQVAPRLRDNRRNAANEEQPPHQREAARRQIEADQQEQEKTLHDLRQQLDGTVREQILSTRNHLSRLEPSAQFIRQLADQRPDEALYALDQILLEEQHSGERRKVEHSGRTLAALFIKNLNRKVQPDKKAFENAVVTWSKELANFKSDYEAQGAEFAAIRQRMEAAEAAWKDRTDALAVEFADWRTASADDLQGLKDTYETHMQLKGPLVYWREKRREHAKGKKVMGWVASISGVIGAGVLIAAAQQLLPASQQADVVPWRSIALFLLISTFVLWLVRLFVKLMLSHIHLYADAREREVMISTFMALVRRQESREGIKQSDLALVLAPIFRPSTTGVISDDGGPAMLTDYIGKLSGK
jgi:hypothetical protein